MSNTTLHAAQRVQSPQFWLRDRLRRLKPEGKSHGGLADALDINASRISEIIKGERKISAAEIAGLANYLEMTESEVLACIDGRDPRSAATKHSATLRAIRDLIVAGIDPAALLPVIDDALREPGA